MQRFDLATRTSLEGPGTCCFDFLSKERFSFSTCHVKESSCYLCIIPNYLGELSLKVDLHLTHGMPKIIIDIISHFLYLAFQTYIYNYVNCSLVVALKNKNQNLLNWKRGVGGGGGGFSPIP